MAKFKLAREDFIVGLRDGFIYGLVSTILGGVAGAAQWVPGGTFGVVGVATAFGMAGFAIGLIAGAIESASQQ